jgi:predicted RNA binding protein YcfA (HicA-like mRNA interferase family)
LLEENRWRPARTRGSYRQDKHPSKTVNCDGGGKPGVDIPPGTLNAILKQAGLKKRGDAVMRYRVVIERGENSGGATRPASLAVLLLAGEGRKSCD